MVPSGGPTLPLLGNKARAFTCGLRRYFGVSWGTCPFWSVPCNTCSECARSFRMPKQSFSLSEIPWLASSMVSSASPSSRGRCRCRSRQCTPSATRPPRYFGGGTPSLLPLEDFRRLFEALAQRFGFAPQCEITVEMDPGRLANARTVVAG